MAENLSELEQQLYQNRVAYGQAIMAMDSSKVGSDAYKKAKKTFDITKKAIADLESKISNIKSANKKAEILTEGHETKPPARYAEPTLVKKLEELGIGRPSTFASIIQTIQDRGYVMKRGRALVPTFLAFSVVGLLEQHFSKLIDYEFTASMEEDLDKIASGDAERIDWLRNFY